MKRTVVLVLVGVAAAWSVPAVAVTVAPGESAALGTFSTPPDGSVVADVSYTTATFTSDFGIPENFESRVSRNADGTLTFAYITTSAPAPGPPFFNDFSSLTLSGFAGMTTDVQVGLDEKPVNGVSPTNLLILSVDRSADGNTLILPGFPTFGPGAPPPVAAALTILVTTNATSFQLSDTGYQPQYLATSFPPPGEPVTTTLVTEPRSAFIPGGASLPEPLSVLTLPLGVAALVMRKRRAFE